MSLKDFVILAKLGQGAYSSVYKVERHADCQIYALKKVKMNSLSEKQQQNALNEVRILASLTSSYIIGYKQAFIENNSLCIVMEYSDDGDLYQKIVEHQKKGTIFDEETIWKTLIQIANGLRDLHDLKILHRDLKSANVFIFKDTRAKLGDMNVSKIAKNGLLYTQTGTPYYASPEVWKDKPYDSKSDIWSLGCVIYEMATLKPPFRAEDMDGLYKRVIKGAYPKIQHFSKSLSSVIKSMLQVNPENRPSAAQLVKNLEVKAKEYDLFMDRKEDINNQLLKTIRANKNLHYLTQRLPKSNYQNGFQYEKTKMNQSVKIKNNSLPKNVNLPKLDRLLMKNNGSSKNPVLYRPPISLQKQERRPLYPEGSSLLKIQGRSNKQAQEHYLNPKKEGNYDLRAELKKIYNLKSISKKKSNKNLLLPKLG